MSPVVIAVVAAAVVVAVFVVVGSFVVIGVAVVVVGNEELVKSIQ